MKDYGFNTYCEKKSMLAIRQSHAIIFFFSENEYKLRHKEMDFLAWHVVICLWQNLLRKSILLYVFGNKNLSIFTKLHCML